jgi:hypothetical protein
MGLRMFGRKNVFFDKPDENINENHRPNQAQEEDIDPLLRKKLIQKEVF